MARKKNISLRLSKCPVCEIVQLEDMVDVPALLDGKPVKICQDCVWHLSRENAQTLNE